MDYFDQIAKDDKTRESRLTAMRQRFTTTPIARVSPEYFGLIEVIINRSDYVDYVVDDALDTLERVLQ